uniref:FERM domain-containing protein n=1 Tax=Caenorhabditis japonica TaxID=281687 RepID=A0A8R1EAB6_CAEJA
MLDNHDRTKLADRLKSQLKKYETLNNMQLEDEFMSMARGLLTYGASFFDVDVFTKKSVGPGLVGVNDHGLHIILKKTWAVFNFRFDEFTAIPKDSKTLEINAERARDLIYTLVSTQMKFLAGILQKFQKR